MKELNTFKKFLNEVNFGNDPESRYEYIRPLLSKLPDNARTEAMIDGMEEGLREDDKELFDYYFVEAMKALGLENELMEMSDPVTKMMKEPLGAPSGNPYAEEPTMTDEEFEAIFGKGPEADEIDDEDLEAAADYFDGLEENDKTLDEIIDEGKFKQGDMVRLKNDDGTGPEFAVISTRKMFASKIEAVRVTDENGKTREYDETQLVKTYSPEEKANVFVRENKVLDASNALEDAINSAADELTDAQIDTITNMILDLRDKVKTQLKKKK